MRLSEILKKMQGFTDFCTKRYKGKDEAEFALSLAEQVDDALSKLSDKVDAPNKQLTKLILAYKGVIDDAKTLEKDLDGFVASGKDLDTLGVAQAESIQAAVKKYRDLMERNLKALQKDKRQFA